MIVTYNSARYLEKCLNSMRSCDELVVLDLGSEDSSSEIASRFGARVVPHPWVSTVEQVRSEAVQETRCEWVCFADPDMVLPEGIIETARSIISDRSDLAILRVGYQNYFQGRPLRFGRWGGTKGRYPLFMEKSRVALGKDVHRGIRILQGVDRSIDSSDALIKHYWCDSWQELREKCRRYLKREATRRRSLPVACILGLATFSRSFFLQRGFVEGFRGFGLSIIAGWYSFKLSRPHHPHSDNATTHQGPA